MILTPNEQEALSAWLSHDIQERKYPNPPVLMKYVRSLILRDANKQSMISYLKDFMGPTVEDFVTNLQDRLTRKDFTFSSAPPPPPPTPVKIEPVLKAVKAEPVVKAEPSKPITIQSVPTSSRISRPPSMPAQTQQKTVKTEPKTEKQEVKSEYKPKPQQIKQEPVQTKEKQIEKTDKKEKKSKPAFKDLPVDKNQQKKDDQYLRGMMALQPPRYIPSSRLFSDVSDEETIETEETETKEIAPPQRYIIFCAGLEGSAKSINFIFKKFTKYGRILAIEENSDLKVCFIEFDELISAFKAVHANPSKVFGNKFIKIDYAFDPNPEALDALQKEYEERKAASIARQKEMQEMQAAKQQQLQEAAAAAAEHATDQQTNDEESELLDELLKTMQEKIIEFEKCTDEANKAQIKEEIQVLSSMMEELAAKQMLISQ